MMLTEHVAPIGTVAEIEPCEPQAKVHSCVLFGSLGDVEIAWEEHNAVEMRDFIAEKMRLGVTFFEILPEETPLRRRRKVASIADLSDAARAVSVPDSDVQKLFSEGKIAVSRTRDKIKSGRPIRDPAAAAEADTVAVPRPVGG